MLSGEWSCGRVYHMTTIEQLITRAKANHPRCTFWFGVRGGGTKKYAQCYICDATIDTWAAKYPQPKHAIDAIEQHLAKHWAEPVVE